MENHTQMGQHTHICFLYSSEMQSMIVRTAAKSQPYAVLTADVTSDFKHHYQSKKVGACADLIDNKSSDRVISTSDTSVSCNFTLVTWQKYFRST